MLYRDGGGLASRHRSNEKVLRDRYAFVPANAIGKGSYSKVYMGRDMETDVSVAIKRIDMSSLSDRSKERMLEEARISNDLFHKNIVETYAIDSDSTYLYIIMEYCSGGDYGKFLHKNGMREAKSQFYMKQLKEALEYLHDRSIVHRDLKPANLLISNESRTLKVADFGFSTVMQNGFMAQTVCGTYYYMAPEIQAGISYTSKCDLWSVGLIIYQSLFGRHPFEEATTPIELKRLIDTKGIVYPKGVNVSPEVLDLMAGLLQKDPYLRISWSEFFNHRWFVPERINRIVPMASNAIPIGIKQTDIVSTPTKKMPRDVSISLGNHVIDEYVPSSSPYDPLLGIRSDEGPIFNVTSPSLLLSQPNMHGTVIHNIPPARKDSIRNAIPQNNNNDTYTGAVINFLSSSLRSLSIFKGKGTN